MIVHAQLASEEQLDRMQALGIIPSFCASHGFYWGDVHVASVLGRERAFRINPARSAGRRGIRFTLHNDAPVVPPNILSLIWSAVTRFSRSSAVIGPEQRLSAASENLRRSPSTPPTSTSRTSRRDRLEVGSSRTWLSAENPLGFAGGVRNRGSGDLERGHADPRPREGRLPDALAETTGDLA